MTRPAAAAISSAKPVMETRNSRPKRSGWPRRSSSAGRPATPIATPTVPRRQARPKLSVITTARPSFAASAAALASGSSGSSRAWPSSPTLDWSMPALAMTKPRRCSTMMRLGRARTTRRLSPRMSSTSRGSLPVSSPSRCAAAEGVTLASGMLRPSAFSFWARLEMERAWNGSTWRDMRGGLAEALPKGEHSRPAFPFGEDQTGASPFTVVRCISRRWPS